jgi:DNA-binding MarR family transcriptional regulator
MIAKRLKLPVMTSLIKPDPTKRRRFDSLEQQAYLHLWRTYDRLKTVEEALFDRHELSAQQYNALRILRAERPQWLATSTLGARLVSRAPDMTRLLDKLEARGLIARQRPPDNRRVVEIAITDAGCALLDALAKDVRDVHSRQLGHLSRGELQQLVELLAAAGAPFESADSDWLPGKKSPAAKASKK